MSDAACQFGGVAMAIAVLILTNIYTFAMWMSEKGESETNSDVIDKLRNEIELMKSKRDEAMVLVSHKDAHILSLTAQVRHLLSEDEYA